jgi:cobalt/nickel transport system permease protein
MHIPDGYLSPSTCAMLTAGAVPFWVAAFRRVQRLFRTRTAPLLAVCAAFSFLLMLFNIPLPGGTTGHAVGMGICTIVLGPAASILALSAALFIQALFFGDGGLLAFGANSFNMAIVGSLVAHGVYRIISGNTPAQAPRRIAAAAVAGYAGINAAAFCAAIEFGLQPTLFHDAAGLPLYAPYPLHIALPAMMLGHLTIAGAAEALVTGGIVAWLQRHHPSLLQPSRADGSITTPNLRPIWAAVAGLLLLTPLGLIATGSAWGEWSADDFRRPEGRAAIAAASGHALAPSHPPAGLEKLATFWTAPFPDYAPVWIKSAPLGYLLSAMTGSGALIAIGLLAEWGWRRNRNPRSPIPPSS